MHVCACVTPRARLRGKTGLHYILYCMYCITINNTVIASGAFYVRVGAWYGMVFRGIERYSVVLHGITWHCMVLPGNTCSRLCPVTDEIL